MSKIPTTEELLEELNLLTKMLLASDIGFENGGGGGDWVKTFCWKRSEKGICNLLNLLTDLKIMRQNHVEEYISYLEDEFVYSLGEPHIIEKYNNFVNTLETEFDNFESYEIRGYGTLFHIGLGLTKNNQWIGLSPLLNEKGKISFGIDLVRIFEKLDREDLDTTQKLKDIIGDLELPVKAKYWAIKSIGSVVELARSKEILVELLLQKANAIKVFYFHHFYNRYWYEDREEGEEEPYLELNIFIQKYLKNTKLYEIGISSDIYFYIIGETPEGDWLGVSTRTNYYRG